MQSFLLIVASFFMSLFNTKPTDVKIPYHEKEPDHIYYDSDYWE